MEDKEARECLKRMCAIFPQIGLYARKNSPDHRQTYEWWVDRATAFSVEEFKHVLSRWERLPDLEPQMVSQPLQKMFGEVMEMRDREEARRKADAQRFQWNESRKPKTTGDVLNEPGCATAFKELDELGKLRKAGDLTEAEYYVKSEAVLKKIP